jgi:hypothetical protein
VLAQENDDYSQIYPNAINIEGLGHSVSLYSINYEHFFRTKYDHLLLSLKAGIGREPGDSVGRKYQSGTMNFPFVISGLLRVYKGHYLQVGIGYAASLSKQFIDSSVVPPFTYKPFGSYYTVGIGYRYMSKDIVFQFYPLFGWTDNRPSNFGISFGLSIGGVFGKPYRHASQNGH